jgi:hypothetical protein
MILVVVALLAGCPGGSDAPDAMVCELGVAWGPRRSPGFAPFLDGDTAEITRGFQGFRYIDSTLRITGTVDAEGEVWFQIEVDQREPYAQRGRIEFPRAEADGARYADVLVFFNDIPIAELVGRSARVTARLASGACEAVHAATVTLADDEECVEQADGGVTCT